MLTEERFERTVSRRVGYRYLQAVPPGDRLPLMVFLHGAGERGSDLALVRAMGPCRRVAAGLPLPFALVAPQCPEGERWDPIAVHALIDEATDRLPVDSSKIVLTGLSMGGEGTWNTALAGPERFRALAVFCGRGVATGRIEVLRNVPTWVVHGTEDSIVPYSESVRMVEALRAAGGDVRFDSVVGADHDVWTEGYENEELYRWLLDHAAANTRPARP